MFSKLLAPIAIFSLIAMVGFLGYTAFVDAQGRGYRCQGTANSTWTTNCNDYNADDCNGNGVLEASSTKECVAGNSTDYCQIRKNKKLRNGSGACSWSDTKKSCRNPQIKDKIFVNNC